MTVYYVAPDYPIVAGGIKKLYDHVSLLTREGIESAIVHGHGRFRLDWFSSDARVIAADDVELSEYDVVVIPEVLAQWSLSLPAGVPRVLLVQNAYQVFRDHRRLIAGSQSPYRAPDVAAIACVSEDNSNVLARCFPDVASKIVRLRYGFDATELHAGDWPRGRRLGYMPRKRRDETDHVLGAMESQGLLEDWDVVPIEGVSYGEVADLLRSCAIFLSFSLLEGFGLPPAEAMLSRSLVVGYSGFGGDEYFRPEYCLPVRDGDVSSFVGAVGEVLRGWGSDGGRYTEMVNRARAHIQSTYGLEHERLDVVSLIERVQRSRRRPTSGERLVLDAAALRAENPLPIMPRRRHWFPRVRGST